MKQLSPSRGACMVLALVALITDSLAQFGTQFVLDTATSPLAYIISATTANNGDIAYLCRGQNGFSSIRRHAPDGTPIWSKAYSTSGLNAGFQMLKADPNGGFLAARQRDSYTQSFNSFDPDTSFIEIDLGSIAENGDVSWVRTFRFQRIHPLSASFVNLFWISALRLSNGEIAFVAEVHSPSFDNSMAVVRLSSDGSQVLHARQFGHYGGPYPVLYPSTSGKAILDPGDGGLLLVTPQGANPSATYPYLVKFDAQGSWVWAKTLNYTSSLAWQVVRKMAFAQNGDILVHHEVNTPGGRTLVHRLSPSGAWLRADLYSDDGIGANEDCLLSLANGGYVIAKRNGDVLIMNDDATLVASYEHPSSSFAEQTYSASFTMADVQGNSLHLYGTFTGVHQIFGNIGSWPLFERFDLSGPMEGCGLSDVSLQHYPVPANLVQVSDPNPPLTLDLTASLAFSSSTWTSSDLGGLAPLDLCVFIDELGVGIAEASSSAGTPMLRTNSFTAHERILAQAPGTGTLELRDALGRLLGSQRASANGQSSLLTPAVAGQYLLVWTAIDGSGRRSERLVVH